MRRALVLLGLLSTLFWVVKASVFSFEDDWIPDPKEEGYFDYFEPVFGSKRRHGKVSVWIEFWRPESDTLSTAKIQLVVLKTSDFNEVGYPPNEDPRFVCCTPERMNPAVPGCNSPGTLILRSGTTVVLDQNVTFFGSDTDVSVLKEVPITENGIYQAIIANCDQEDAEYYMDGYIGFKSSTGWLNAGEYGFLVLYSVLCAIYFLACLIWGTTMFFFKEDVLKLHYVLSLVLGFFFLESLIWACTYGALSSFRNTPAGIAVIGVIMTVFRETLFRMVGVALATGYTIIRPHIGSAKNAIFIGGALYLLFDMIFDMYDEFSVDSPRHTSRRQLLSFPLAFLNAFFAWMFYLHLTKTISDLEARNQTAKLRLFKRFRALVLGSLFVAFFFEVWRFMWIRADLTFSKWSSAWFFSGGFDDLLFTFIIFATLFLWRPQPHAATYANVHQVPSSPEDADEFGLEMKETSETDAMFEVEPQVQAKTR